MSASAPPSCTPAPVSPSARSSAATGPSSWRAPTTTGSTIPIYRKAPRFKAMGLIPLQEPAEAVIELQAHRARLGLLRRHAALYRRQYAASGFARNIGRSTAKPNGWAAPSRSTAAPTKNVDGRPESLRAGQRPRPSHEPDDLLSPASSSTASSINFPALRIGFMEAGSAWLLTCMERFTGSWESHVQYDPRGRFLQLQERRKDHRLHSTATSTRDASSSAAKAKS